MRRGDRVECLGDLGKDRRGATGIHVDVHQHLLDRLEAFWLEFQLKGHLTDEFFLFLKMWLKSHICGIDTQYAKQAHAA